MANNIPAAFFTDTESPESLEVQNTQLAEISALADQQLQLEDDLSKAEAAVDNLKDQLRKIREVALPEAMAAVGMEKFKLSSGYEIKIKDGCSASIRAGFEHDATGWLEENGFGDVVKDEVKVNFGRGEDPTVLLQFCQAQRIPFSEKLSVHASTLAALVREQLKKGVAFPEEFFNVYTFKKAEITLPKKK